MSMIHYISAGYLIISLALAMTRKHSKRFLLMIPPVCQVASVYLLKGWKFPIHLTALLLLLNLALLVWVDMMEKKEMDLLPAEPAFQRSEPQEPASRPWEKPSSFAVDTDLLSKPLSTAAEVAELPETEEVAPKLPVTEETVLIQPEKENKPINEVAPVQQEIFDASKGEVKEMIENLMESGDIANAKRYLRMLAFFAKDESSRKIAEKKLAELNAKA